MAIWCLKYCMEAPTTPTYPKPRPLQAVALAQEAVLEAQQKLDQASSSFRETSLIIKLLKDNVALWTSEGGWPRPLPVDGT